MIRRIFLFLILTALVFPDPMCGDQDCENTISIGEIVDVGDGNVSITLLYSFAEDVAGFQFDLSTDGVITFDVETLSLGANLAQWQYTKANSSGSIVGFDVSLSTLRDTGELLTIQGTYDMEDIGQMITIDASEDCANGTGDSSDLCRKADGDTRMILSSANATPVGLTHFQEEIWTVGTSGSVLGNETSGVYSYSLSSNYPNPFNPTTTINYSIEKAGDVSVVIYDMTGREVRTLVSQSLTPGSYSTVWDSMNNAGVEASAGMYIYKMISRDFVQSNKMLLIK